MSFREAAGWTAVWIALGLAFNVGLCLRSPRLRGRPRLATPGFDADAAAWQAALEFLTGYVMEYALSIDNIFIFVLVLGYFAVPSPYQHRVLSSTASSAPSSSGRCSSLLARC